MYATTTLNFTASMKKTPQAKAVNKFKAPFVLRSLVQNASSVHLQKPYSALGNRLEDTRTIKLQIKISSVNRIIVRNVDSTLSKL